MSSPPSVRIVLVNTTHPGNIGAVARAMKNMGLRGLYLVDPAIYPSAEATARASGADDVLAEAVVCGELRQAIEDCPLVIGASARTRAIDCPRLTPRECAALIRAHAGPAAVVFGREHSGLSNAELDLCHYQLSIPVDPAFPSLNLAAAVQIFAYEHRLAGSGAPEAASAAVPTALSVSSEEMERFYQHLEQVIIEIGFLDPTRPRHLMRRLRRLYNRARPDQNEMNILRGILTAMQTRRP
jgi:TrmH family RNA methyltransferase